MRLSLLEIIIIVLVLLTVLVAVRIIGAGRSSQVKDTAKGKKYSLEIPGRQVEQSSRKGLQIKLAGVVFILVSILLVLAGMSMFKWVLKSYLWSFILLAIGLSIIFMSRKR